MRLQLWQSAWQMFLDHPWLGVGPDNFLYAYRSVYALPAAWEELHLSHPHNLFLDLLTRVGLLGFLAGLWLLAATLISGFKRLLSASLRPSLSRLSASRITSAFSSALPPDSSTASSIIPFSWRIWAILTFLVVGVTARIGSQETEGRRYSRVGERALLCF